MKSKNISFLNKNFLHHFTRIFCLILVFYGINIIKSEKSPEIITFQISSPDKSPFEPIAIEAKIQDAEKSSFYMISLFSPIISYDDGISKLPGFSSLGTGKTINNNIPYSSELEEGTKYSGNVILISQSKSYTLQDTKILWKSNSQREGYIVNHSCIGLSYSLNSFNSYNFQNGESVWDNLKALNVKKIFSISKMSQNTISYSNKYSYKYDSVLYLGDVHEDFTKASNIDNIGSCKINNNDLPFWGCSFSKFKINNMEFNLTDENNNYYTSYFVSEDYNIILPLKFVDNFIKSFQDKYGCQTDDRNKLICKNFEATNETSLPIEFTDEKKEFSITGEIHDSGFYEGFRTIQKDSFTSNLYFQDINYLVLPIYMFKNFHILFDGENNTIKFFGKNLKKLLSKEEEKGGNGFIIIIVIICILIVVLLLVLGYFFVIKKKSSGGRFHILDEDEDFHNMNENRVY